MLNRTTQNDLAKGIMENHEFRDSNNNLLTSNSDIFFAEVNRRNMIFRDFVSGGERTEKEVTEAKAPVAEAISYYNDEQLLMRLEHFKTLPGKEAMSEYLDNQCVSGLKHTLDRNAGWIIKTEEPVALSACDFVRTVCELEYKGIIDACCIIVDNIATNEFGDDATLSRNSLHQSYIEMRDRKGWNLPEDKKKTPKELAAMLTELCNMISFGMAPTMKKMDVKYVKFAAIQVKNVANKAGKFVVRGNATIVESVFRALYTRKNNLSYDWDNKLYDTQVAALTAVAPNKDMAESAASEKDNTEGGPITVGIPETK